MGKPVEIDAFSLCASPLAAPAILATVGLAGAWTSSPGGVFSVLFWQAILAFEYAPIYYAISLPLAWAIWRAFPEVATTQKSVTVPLIIATLAFAASSNARAFGIRSVGPLEPETFSIFFGVVLNAIFFVWLARRPNLSVPQHHA